MIAKKKKQSKYVEVHVLVPKSDFRKWEAYKQARYNGLRAMSQVIRDFVNAGVENSPRTETTTPTTRTSTP